MTKEFVPTGQFSMRHKLGDRWVLRTRRVVVSGGFETPVDVSGITYRCQWRVSPEDVAPAQVATIDATDAVNGVVLATVLEADSRALGEGTWRYEFEDVTNGTTLIEGLVTQTMDTAR